MEPADNAFVTTASLPPTDEHRIDSASAPSVSEQFRHTLSAPDERTVRRLALLIDANARADKRPTGIVYAPTPIVSTPFRQSAEAAVEGHQDDPALRAQAAALARGLVPDLPPAAEASTVNATLAIAANLGAPRQRLLESAARKRSRSPSVDDLRTPFAAIRRDRRAACHVGAA